MKGIGKKVLFWTYTASAFLLAPKAFGQGSSDWSDYEQQIEGALNVAKKSAKGAGEFIFGTAPLFVVLVASVGAWWGARKKAQREDKDDKVIPLLIGVVAGVLSFALVLFVYMGLDKVGIPAMDKARDFWGGG